MKRKSAARHERRVMTPANSCTQDAETLAAGQKKRPGATMPYRNLSRRSSAYGRTKLTISLPLEGHSSRGRETDSQLGSTAGRVLAARVAAKRFRYGIVNTAELYYKCVSCARNIRANYNDIVSMSFRRLTTSPQ